MDILTQFGIALVAGCGASMCVHPLDVIRVNLQVDQGSGGTRQYKGMLNCGSTIFKRGGPTALYSGLRLLKRTIMLPFKQDVQHPN